MIWLTADTHYHHKNICLGTSTWEDKSTCRNFNSLKEMDDSIIDSINSQVKKDDTLYHLGDWSFGSFNEIWNFRSQIICRNIILILGNHDDKINKNIVLPNGVRAKFIFDNVFDSPQSLVLESGQKIILGHYPFEDWEDKYKGSIHIHGHCHHNIDNTSTSMFDRRFDVGWEGKVYKLDDIVSEMNKREIKK